MARRWRWYSLLLLGSSWLAVWAWDLVDFCLCSGKALIINHLLSFNEKNKSVKHFNSGAAQKANASHVDKHNNKSCPDSRYCVCVCFLCVVGARGWYLTNCFNTTDKHSLLAYTLYSTYGFCTWCAARVFRVDVIYGWQTINSVPDPKMCVSARVFRVFLLYTFCIYFRFRTIYRKGIGDATHFWSGCGDMIHRSPIIRYTTNTQMEGNYAQTLQKITAGGASRVT